MVRFDCQYLSTRIWRRQSELQEFILYGNAIGEYDRYTPAETREQLNFEARVVEEESCLRSTIKELELMIPEPEIAGAYEPGEEYQFYRDLKTIVGFSARELFIIDNYLDA